MELIKNILEFLNKMSFKVAMGVALVVTSILLIIPSAALQKLYLTGVMNKIGPIVGLLFLLALVINLYNLITCRVIKLFRVRRRQIQYLTRMSPSEKTILHEYMVNNTKNRPFSLQRGDVQLLIKNGFLEQNTNVGHASPYGPSFDITMQDWLWKYLQSNKDVWQSWGKEQ